MPSEADAGIHRCFFLPPPWPAPGQAGALPEEEGHHAARVLRLKRGDAVRLVDGAGRECEGWVQHVDGAAVSVRLGPSRAAASERVLAGRLGLAWIRTPARLDWAVEKATELGIVGIDLFGAQRSVGWKTLRGEERAVRLERVTRAAMKQAGRACWPRVAVHASLAALLEARSGMRMLWAAPMGETMAGPLLAGSAARDTLLLVGPEGGWTGTEEESLRSAGATCVTLGPRRLRTETAAALLCALAARIRGTDESQPG